MPLTEEQLENVAFAIWERSRPVKQSPLMNAREFWDRLPEHFKDDCREQSKAAIEAYKACLEGGV